MKILSLDVSGNYSSISLLNDDEVNTFTQLMIEKTGLIGIGFLQVLALIQKKVLIILMGLLLLVARALTLLSELLPPF